MIKFTGCFVFLFFTIFSSAQIVVNNEATADQVIETLVGSGITYSNVTINCPDVSYGTFEGTSNMGIENGIIMTSGDAKLAEGPNNEEGAYLNNFSWVEDTDLQALIPDYDIMDACVIEFDFIPAGDMLTFEYVFGSEEYPDFLEGDFNDVFGFFVSGPGIEGEFSSGAINVAVVPDTDLPVSIQTINNGSVVFDMENGITSCGGPCVNCEYFMCNGNGDNFFNEPFFYDPTFIQYNGFTTKLTSSIQLTPGETYHIKLAISDAGDSTYDSGVFLAGKSFSTNEPLLTSNGIEGEEVFTNATAGCTNGQFTFELEEAFSCDVMVNFEIGGTAVSGVDYEPFDNFIMIPQNTTSKDILVEILDDEMASGDKTIELSITGLSEETCGSIELVMVSLTIEDKPVFSVSEEIEITKGESVNLEAAGGSSYDWNGTFENPAEQTQNVTPEETTDYQVTIGYGRCSETLATRVVVNEPDAPCELEVSFAEVEVCNDAIYAINIEITGASTGDAISVSDSDGTLLSTFTFNNDAVRVGPVPKGLPVLTITNNTDTTCAPLVYDTTDDIIRCENPTTCSISVTMGSIASCTRNAYDLQLMLTGVDNGESFSVSTANGTDLGTYNYSDMPVLVADIPVDQTVLFIQDLDSTDCTTQTIDIFPVVQACVNLVPQCTLIEATPSVTDCTDNDFTLSLDVNTNSSGNSFRVSDNLGNSLGIYNYDDVPVTISSLPLEVTSLTITDSGNSECTTQTDDLTEAVDSCRADIPMCSLSIASAEVISCTDGNYTLQLNVSGMDAGASFSVSDASGNDLGTYNYADVPVEISPIAISESVLTINDNDNADCSANTEDLAQAIQEACTEEPMGGNCNLSTATATIVDCTDTNYNITLEVMGENTGTSFTVSDSSGNELGIFNYADMSIEINDIQVTESVLTITDNDSTNCSINTNDLEEAILQTCIISDDCSISAAMATFNACTETEYSILLGVMGENLGTSFTVTDASGNDLGTYNYADMPVEVSGIAITESILTITDSDNMGCSANTNDLASAIQMCPGVEPTCNLSSAVAMLSSCTETDYVAMIMVAGENTGTTFNITDAAGNDLGTYNYSDSPIELSGLATTSSVFTITDGVSTDCSATTNDLAADIQNCQDVDETCSVMAMAMLSTCTLNDYTLMLVVNGQNTGSSFTVTNASGTDLGTYNYADSPIEISGVALTDEAFIITDSDDGMCVASTNNIAAEIKNCVDDLTPPTGECSISFSDVSITECENSTFSVEVSVSGMNVSTTFKAVSLNGVSAGNFNYADSPFQINNLPIDQNYLYFIDNVDKSCFALANLSDLINACLNPGTNECTLDVSAGFLTLDNYYVCGGESPATNLIDTTLPQGYTTYYVFHNNANLTPTSISNTQVYSVVDSSLNLENSLIPCGAPVYITAIIAEQALNLADVDLSATCTTFGNTVEIALLCPISIDVEELCNQATGTFVLNVVVKGGLPAFETDSEFDISGDIYTGNSGNEELISIADLPDGSDYRIVATDEFGCTTEVSGNITCVKKLPVELITFTGEARPNGNLLKWSTASEIQNDFFTIEHSTDAINYTELTVVDGSGTVNEVTNYDFLDRTAANGTTYYRLSQTDFDGTTKVEGFVFINRGENIGINIAGINPVPFVNELNIQLSSTDDVFVRFSLTDLSGRLMVRNEYNLISGLTEISLDTKQLAVGIYLLRIETNTGSIVKKVVKH